MTDNGTGSTTTLRATGISLLVGGAALALSGNWTVVVRSAFGLDAAAVGLFAAMLVATAGAFLVVERLDPGPAAAARFVRVAGYSTLGVAALAAAPGWGRFFGFAVEGHPGLGSVGAGAACLMLVAGAVAFAWCRTPLLPEGKGDREGAMSPRDLKHLVTGGVALVAFVLPGMFALSP